MTMLKPTNDFFALDIAADSIHVVQLKGAHRGLHRYGSTIVDKRTARSDAPADKKRLMEIVAELVKKIGITSKDVVVSIPADKAYVTIVDMPKLSGKEMEKSVAYQADQFVPMASDQVKIDWQILGTSPAGPDKAEVLIASVANDYAESRLDLLESIGLNVVAMEPEQFALVRALMPPGLEEATIILDMSPVSTNLVAVYQGMPRLIRAIPTGGEAIIRSAVQNLGIDESQATQFVYKFGLVKNKLEGQVFNAIQNVVDSLIDEVNKSIKFFDTRYQNTKISKIIVTGELAILPEFPLYLVNRTQTPVEIGNSWLNVSFNDSLRNELASISHQYSVAVGLAERN